MRTIKFRGRKGLRGWYYGSLVQKSYINSDDEYRVVSYIIDDLPIAIVPEGHVFESEVVDSSTVGQFTGFKDANGVEIYDGDIFQVNGGPYHLIKWLDELGGFGTCNLCSMRQLKDWPDHCLFGIPSQGWWRDFNREIIVVGNIHDNPDFLEKFKER